MIDYSMSLGGLITVKDAAAALRLHPETVYKWVRTGKVKAYRVRGIRNSIRIKLEDLLVEYKAQDAGGGRHLSGVGSQNPCPGPAGGVSPVPPAKSHCHRS